MRKALARAGAEQHDLDTEALQEPEILHSERVEALDRPIPRRSASTTTLEARRSPFTIT